MGTKVKDALAIMSRMDIQRLRQQVKALSPLDDPPVPGRARHLRPHSPLGWLAPAALHEIEGASWDAETGACASGFAAICLARLGEEGMIVWAMQRDAPFAPALAARGLAPERVIFARCRNDGETLAVVEDALRTKGIAAALGEVSGVGLTASRRLHLICERMGNSGLLLRRPLHGKRGGKREGTASVTRWRVSFAPSATNEPGLGPPRFRLDLLYCRGGFLASWIMEWDDETHHLRVVAKLAGDEGDALKSRAATG